MSNFSYDFALAAWREVGRDGEFAMLRRGSDIGWWHDHNDGTEVGTHPMDYNKEFDKWVCRDCGKEKAC